MNNDGFFRATFFPNAAAGKYWPTYFPEFGSEAPAAEGGHFTQIICEYHPVQWIDGFVM